LSIRQPGRPTELSLPIRQRRATVWPAAAGGRFTVVVTNPLELPLHASLPTSGLFQPLGIVVS
jgi:hypothetical protein